LAQAKQRAHDILCRIGFEVEEQEEQFGLRGAQHTLGAGSGSTLAPLAFDRVTSGHLRQRRLPALEHFLKCGGVQTGQSPHPAIVSQSMWDRNHGVSFTSWSFPPLLPIIPSNQ
jgi:hypothetical protein